MLIARFDKNPILKPDLHQSWEADAVFNGCPAKRGENIYLLYRAMSLPHYHTAIGARIQVSDIGIATSRDGMHFSDRKRFIVPEENWEKFGCEDPRVTELDGTYYIFYTALSQYPYRAEGIKVGVALSRDLKTIQSKHLVTPFNAKAMTIFPEKINGKIWGMLTVHTDMPPASVCLVSFDTEEDIWSERFWRQWYKQYEQHALPLRRRPQDHIEVGTPPIKTKYGWLILYSYIQNYFSGNRLFGIEAALLDLTDPSRIIATTKMPILTPEEYYERIGLIPNIIFPSGALIQPTGLFGGNNTLWLYYGATDTTCCLAFIDLPAFLDQFLLAKKTSVTFQRAKENPIIAPVQNHAWEKKATFNPGALLFDNTVHLIYRAMSDDNTSVLGYATTKNGTHINYRYPEPIYMPRAPFEKKLQPGGNSGVEDPRLTKIDDTIFMLYTAFDGKNLPRVALTSIHTNDFVRHTWNWAEPVLISAPDLFDKDACLFPEKIQDKYIIIHRVGDDMDLAYVTDLNTFDGKTWLEEYRWITPRKGWWDSRKVGAAAPPIKTKDGWLLLYHGVSDDHIYRVGALLLDLKDPSVVLGRTIEPLLEPTAPYEKNGQVANVVFPCGAVVLGENLCIYYGAADQTVCAASMKMKVLLDLLKNSKY